MAQPIDPSTEAKRKRSEEVKKALEALPRDLTLEQAVEFAQKYPEVKYSMNNDQKADFDKQLKELRTSAAEQPRSDSSAETSPAK